jgi:hypothetical protein
MACWPQAIATANETTPTPEVRALVSDDERVWLIAPLWEGNSARGLVCVTEYLHGPVVLRDIDRKLVTYSFQIPSRKDAAAGWIEAGHLLIPAT